MKKAEQIILLLTCILVVAVAAIQRDGKILGHDIMTPADTARAEAVSPISTLSDGTEVINTTEAARMSADTEAECPLRYILKTERS